MLENTEQYTMRLEAALESIRLTGAELLAAKKEMRFANVQWTLALDNLDTALENFRHLSACPTTEEV
jgi:hypothetical protein